MFERFTEKARRVIFFARYEASQYGNAYIETEHLLLGLVREDPGLLKRCLGDQGVAAAIRADVERRITRGQPFATSVEVPLTAECQRSLQLAAEESKKAGLPSIGTEHLLLGLLGTESSLGQRILLDRGAKLETIRAALRKSPRTYPSVYARPSHAPHGDLESFLARLKWNKWDEVSSFFAQLVQFVDAKGKRWTGRAEIAKQFENLFAPYAKKNATYLIESVDSGPSDSFVANVLWENVGFGSEPPKTIHRMTAVLGPEGNDWGIFLLQVTPVALR